MGRIEARKSPSSRVTSVPCNLCPFRVRSCRWLPASPNGCEENYRKLRQLAKFPGKRVGRVLQCVTWDCCWLFFFCWKTESNALVGSRPFVYGFRQKLMFPMIKTCLTFPCIRQLIDSFRLTTRISSVPLKGLAISHRRNMILNRLPTWLRNQSIVSAQERCHQRLM